MNLGSWDINDLLTFTVNTHHPTTGVPTDADSAPTYRVYEDETTTPILTGTMALLDGSNTAGLYSEQITLSAANGLEKGKSYTIRILATVASVDGVTLRFFQIGAAVDAAYVAGAVPETSADVVTDLLAASLGTGLGTVLQALQPARVGTAQAGGASTITLDASASAVDDFYNNKFIVILAGTGAGQSNFFSDYVGSTKVGTMRTAWATVPDNTSVFLVR